MVLMRLFMKATQYLTMQNLHLRPYGLKPAAGRTGGAATVEIGDAPYAEDLVGFGVAITGSSCYLLNKMQKERRDEFLKGIYGEKGLGLSVGRITMASSDYSAELYSYDDTEGDTALEHFTVERDKEYVIPMISEVLKVNPSVMLFASPWSPPGWMKTGGSICGGYMRAEYIDIYADYFIKFLRAYEENGLKISAVTPQNEPENTQDGRMPACVWHPDLEARFISVLKKKLDRAGLDTEIWMHDHNFGHWQRVLWMLKEYPALIGEIGGIAFHYYSGSAEDLDYIRKEFPTVKFHFTEGGPRLNDNYDNDWCKWGIMMSKALNHGCRTFTGWNLLLDETGGPNVGPFFCGGLATLNSQTEAITYSGQYKAFGHFSSFMKRDAKIYPSNVAGDNPKMSGYPNTGSPLEVCAAKNPDGSLVLVAVNPNKTKRQLQCFYGGKWWYTELMPDSVSTVVFENS